MEIHLPSVPMMKILSYLDAFTLLQVAQVNKSWNAVASSDVLWRKFCRKRWLFYDNVNLQHLGTETWKQFYIYRTWQEHAKSRAKPEDFTYKEIPAENEVLAHPCYISGRGLTRNGQGKSVVCFVSSMNRISTWDIHEGVMTWESPGNPTVIKWLTTLPEMHIAVTVDTESTIKLWDCQNRDPLAMNNLISPCLSLKAVDTQDGPIVLAGDTSGNLCIFRIPDLHLISRIHVFPYGIDEIYCSPQKKWVCLNRRHPHIFPKDPVHVIVTLHDGSLDVYAWEERTPKLRRCYGLQNRRCLPSQSYVEKTLCDNVSIIRLMRNGPAPCFLTAYTLNSDLEN